MIQRVIINTHQDMLKLILICLVAVLASSFQPCEPFGTRLFYGQIIKNQTANQKLEIYQNTPAQCNYSYVVLITKSGSKKMSCQTTFIKLSPKVKNYETYVHKCSTSEITYDEPFIYNIYGWDGISNQIAFSKTPITASISDITNPLLKVNLIVLADWSYLQKMADKYARLDDLFQKVLSEQKIDGLAILGDIGYDLDTNNCLNYEKFLVMLSQVSKRIPIILVTGNHQYNTPDNYQLYQKSFQLYELDTSLTTVLNVGALSLVAFDPYQVIYNKDIKEDPVISRFTQNLNIAKNGGRFVVPMSHYALACMGKSFCQTVHTVLKNYWQAMLDSQISLYIGAHLHSYQRVFPYYRNGSFGSQSDDYRTNDNYLVSIVEGIAGNDNYIIEAIDVIEPFIASYTLNETGFGILSVDTNAVLYRHISTKQGVTDYFKINNVRHNNLVAQS